MTIKYDNSGDTVWASRYNGMGTSVDYARAIALDGNGNVYVTGFSDNTGYNAFYETIKYNARGVRQWVARYNGEGNASEATAIAVDRNANVYVTGESVSSTTFSDYATVKYNSSGNRIWAVIYDGPGNCEDIANAIAADSSGNVYVTGGSTGSDTSSDYATIKYNSSGDTMWVRRYNGPGNYEDIASAITLDNRGNVYVTGYSDDSVTGGDYATIKYDSSGNTIWVARYNGPGNGSDYARAIATDKSGNVYVTGYSKGAGTSYDYATIKYNSSGDTMWVRRYNGPGNGNDEATAIALDDSGNAYVTGWSIGSGTDADYATIKYDSSGALIWVARYNGPGNYEDIATAIALDGNGSVYVTGYIDDASQHKYDDYATIKYYCEAGIEEKSNNGSTFTTSQNTKIQIEPSPFVKVTTIYYQLPAKANVSLKLYDLSGRVVRTLEESEKQEGIYEVKFSREDLTTGIYFVRFTAGSYKETKKVVLMK